MTTETPLQDRSNPESRESRGAAIMGRTPPAGGIAGQR